MNHHRKACLRPSYFRKIEAVKSIGEENQPDVLI